MQHQQTDIAQTRRSGKILLWVPLAALLGLTSWFLWWSYASKVEQAEHAELGKLQAMVRTLAHNIDGGQHAHEKADGENGNDADIEPGFTEAHFQRQPVCQVMMAAATAGLNALLLVP